MIRTILASAAVAVLSVGAASAATLSFSATPTPFLSPNATQLTGTLENNVTFSVSGQRLSPWGEDSDGPFSRVAGTAEYTFDALSTFFNLVWGSPDSHNTLIFFNDNTEVDSVNGSAIQGFGEGVNVPNSLVSIVTVAAFNRVVFSSVLNDFANSSFEWAAVTNVEYVPPVPLPAGGLLLLTGLAGVAALRRRKSV